MRPIWDLALKVVVWAANTHHLKHPILTGTAPFIHNRLNGLQCFRMSRLLIPSITRWIAFNAVSDSLLNKTKCAIILPPKHQPFVAPSPYSSHMKNRITFNIAIQLFPISAAERPARRHPPISTLIECAVHLGLILQTLRLPQQHSHPYSSLLYSDHTRSSHSALFLQQSYEPHHPKKPTASAHILLPQRIRYSSACSNCSLKYNDDNGREQRLGKSEHNT